MPEFPNKLVKNRPSPKNGSRYIEEYKKMNPKALQVGRNGYLGCYG